MRNDANDLLRRAISARLQGRVQHSEILTREAILRAPNRTESHFELGVVLAAQARYPEAIASFREAIRLRGDVAEIHFRLALALQSQGDFSGAEESHRAALALAPEFLFAKQGLAAALTGLGREAEAETILRGLLDQSLGDPQLLAGIEHDLALCLSRQRRQGEALQHFDRALARGPDVSGAGADRAALLASMHRNDDAVAAYRRVLIADPLNARAHRELNHLLYRTGDDENFLRSYEEALLRHPLQPFLLIDKADFLFRTEQFDAAEDCFGRAAQLHPSALAPLNGLAAIAAHKADFAKAIDFHRKAISLVPDNIESWCSYIETLLRAREVEPAREAAEKTLELRPNHQGAIAYLSLALRCAGDAREAWLNDYEKFVQLRELSPPDGYADMKSFNRDLESALGALHRDNREFLDQSVRGGTQTLNDLFSAHHRLVDLLRVRIDEAVASYIAQLGEDGAHPLLGRKAREFSYAGSWSSRLSDCGFHTNHVHPQGWISSAYYVAVPDAVADAAAKQGWIKFGEPSFDAGFRDPIRRSVQPRPGTLVLFPSYMWHGTVPFHSQQPRTTIAFDVVPR